MTTKAKISTKIRISPPKMTAVILLNDDRTTMQFVVTVLIDIFRKSPSEAYLIMQHIHEHGEGHCGEYTHDIAATKLRLVVQAAAKAGYPLSGRLQ